MRIPLADTSLFEESRIKSTSNQWLFFKTFLPFYLKLRFKKIVANVVPLLILLISFLLYVFDKSTIEYPENAPLPDVDFEPVYNYFAPYIQIDNKYDVTDIHMYPRNFIADIFESEEINESYIKYFAYNDKAQFNAALANNSEINGGFNIFYNMENLDTTKTVDYYYRSNEEIKQADIENAFVSAFLKKEGLEIGYDNYVLGDPYVSNTFSAFMSNYLSICLPFVFLFSFIEVINFMTTKFYILLTVSGAYESTIWLVFILTEVCYSLVFTLILTGIILQAKCLGNHNFFLMWAPLFMACLALYTMILACIPFIRKTSYFIFLIVGFVILGCGTALLQFVINIGDPKKRNALHISSYFVPFIGLSSFYLNIDHLDCYNKTLNFATVKEGIIMPSSEVILAEFVCILIYSLLFVLFELFLPRASGSPPIGFKNIFNLKRWKSLFSKTEIKQSTDDGVPLIQVNNISKTYSSKSGKTFALKNESFTIGRNEVIVLIGPNGCGKSTLLNSMSGTIDCEAGELFINGKKAELGFREMQSYLGIAFQENVLFENLSVKDHLEFFGKIRGMRGMQLQNELYRIVSSLEMNDILNMKAGTLSGGQKRKLCIAAAFIGSPPIVILDEPTAGIDVNARQLIWKAISQFKDSACFVTSHSLEEAESVASRMFIMKHGNIIFQDTVSKLRYDYHCGYRLAPIGENVNIQSLLEFCNTFVENSSIDDERNDSILVPISSKIPDLFEQLDQRKDEFGIDNFTVTVEQLEHVILRMINDEE